MFIQNVVLYDKPLRKWIWLCVSTRANVTGFWNFTHITTKQTSPKYFIQKSVDVFVTSPE